MLKISVAELNLPSSNFFLSYRNILQIAIVKDVHT